MRTFFTIPDLDISQEASVDPMGVVNTCRQELYLLEKQLEIVG
jgi:hypothetical protein